MPVRCGSRERHRASALRWEEVARPDHAAMLGWYRDLSRLRRQRRDVVDPRLDTVDVRRR
jgi:maltooligosyltrehalose trehalohydrolase